MQSVDRAEYRRKVIGSETARLIACHLHRGPGSALYAFAVSGAIGDRLFEELDEGSPQPSAAAQTLGRCPGGLLPGARGPGSSGGVGGKHVVKRQHCRRPSARVDTTDMLCR